VFKGNMLCLKGTTNKVIGNQSYDMSEVWFVSLVSVLVVYMPRQALTSATSHPASETIMLTCFLQKNYYFPKLKCFNFQLPEA